MGEANRHPDPAGRVIGPLGRHILSDDFAEGWRALSNIHDEVDHMTLDCSDELAHIGIPLSMQTADDVFLRMTLVRLKKFLTDFNFWMVNEVTFSEDFREVSPFIRKSLVGNHFYFGDF